jgi:hypothetical protein
MAHHYLQNSTSIAAKDKFGSHLVRPPKRMKHKRDELIDSKTLLDLLSNKHNFLHRSRRKVSTIIDPSISLPPLNWL